MRGRAYVLPLLLIPAVVAWVGAVRGDLAMLFLAGTGAILAGGLAFGLPGARIARVAVVTACFATVPAAAAVPLAGLAARRRPLPPYTGFHVRLPTASTARVYRVHGDQACFVTIRRTGLAWDRNLREIERRMPASKKPVYLLVDRDVPWRHVGLVLGLAKSAGQNQVWLAVNRPDEAWSLYWLPVSLAAHPPGGAVRIKPADSQPAALGGPWGRREVRYATAAVFRFGDRETRAVAELDLWFRDERPGRIAAFDGAPYWAVVAAIDRARRAGRRTISLGALPAPTPEEWETSQLPYPAQR